MKSVNLTDIKSCIAVHSIPLHLVLNADQTPSSYISVEKTTMAAHNSSSMPIKGLTDKRNITLTFCNLFKRRLPAYANNIIKGRPKQVNREPLTFHVGS